MFEDIIMNEDYAGELANFMFRRIGGVDFCADQSMTCTLRIMLANRIGDHRLETNLNSFTFTSDDDFTAFQDIKKQFESKSDRFEIINLKSNIILNNEDKVKEAMLAVDLGENFLEFKNVTTYFEKKMTCRVFVNEITRTTVIFVLNLDVRRWHLLQSILPKYFPWYFENKTITFFERKLLYSLQETVSLKYVACLNDYSSDKDYITNKGLCAIGLFKRKVLERQKEECEHNIHTLACQIEDYYSQISKLMQNQEKSNLELLGVITRMKDQNNTGDETLAAFLKNNKDIEIVDLKNSKITFIAKGYLDIFDPENYTTCSNNSNSYYWCYSSDNYSEPFKMTANRKMLLDNVFCDDPKFRIKCCGKYSFDLSRFWCNAEISSYFADKYENCYPNPHHQYHGCLGSYRSPITNFLQKGDLVGAFSQILIAVRGVNVTESASFGHLCREIFAPGKKWFEDMDGNAYDAEEALNKLLQQNEVDVAAQEQGE